MEKSGGFIYVEFETIAVVSVTRCLSAYMCNSNNQ